MTAREKALKILELWHKVDLGEILWLHYLRDTVAPRILLDTGYTIWKIEFNDTYSLQNVKVFAERVHHYEPWDLVEILPSIKNDPHWEKWRPTVQEMIGWPFTIKHYDWSQYKVYAKNKFNYYTFNPQYLAPRFPEEYTKEEAEREFGITIID